MAWRLLVGVMALWTSPVFGQTSAHGASFRQETLPNGLRLVTVRTGATGLAAIHVLVRAGSAWEGPGEQGAAHCLEHMLLRGSTTRPGAELDLMVETCGGMLNAATTRDFAHYYVTVNAEAVTKVLPLLAEVLREPRLDPTDVERERGIILDELARRLTLRAARLQDAAFKAAYPEQPVGRSLSGTPEDIRSITRNVLQDFHRRLYRPDRCVVVVAGDVRHEDARRAVEAAFGSWSPATDQKNEPRASLPNRPWLPGTVGPLAVVLDSAEPPVTFMVWRTPPAERAEDVLMAEVVAALLEGSLARVSAELSRPACVSVPTAFGGALVAWSEGNDKHITDRLNSTIARLAADGPSPTELADATRMVAGRYLYEVETLDGLARAVAMWASYGDPGLPLEVRKRGELVTPARVRDYVRRLEAGAAAPSEANARN